MIRILTICALALGLAACQAQEESAAANGQALAEAKAFMASNAQEEGVRTLASGLQYEVVRSGPETGLRPQEGDEIKVHYEGRLSDGTVFDSSYERGQPVIMPLGEGLIPGWQEALKLMRPGDEWIVYIPPELGYGAEGAGGGQIPPNAALTFRIELLGVLPRPGRVQQG